MKNFHIIFVLIVIVSTVSCGADDKNEGNIKHLCEGRNDLPACVREYFDDHAHCSVIRRPNDKPIYRERHYVYMPKVNLTVITTQTTLSNLNGTIETFYINKDTGNLVMTVNFKNISLDSPVTYFHISQRGLEPIILTDKASGLYPAILTAVIPAKRRITEKIMKKVVVTAYLPVGDVTFSIGPNVTQSTNPVVAGVVKALLADVPTAVQEIFVTESSSYFLAYLQKYICNFGISISD